MRGLPPVVAVWSSCCGTCLYATHRYVPLVGRAPVLGERCNMLAVDGALSSIIIIISRRRLLRRRCSREYAVVDKVADGLFLEVPQNMVFMCGALIDSRVPDATIVPQNGALIYVRTLAPTILTCRHLVSPCENRGHSSSRHEQSKDSAT